MSTISIQSLHKTYGNVPVLRGIDLDIASGEFVVFVGHSGCGKSTLLRCIAGLETISKGNIYINGRDVTGTAPSKRGIAMVFQSYALYPHLTVRDNLGFSLNLARLPKMEIAQKVDLVAQTLRINDLLDRRPGQLSGGQRQRVAIGRAIVREPEAFLFDEPLSNLDADLRVQMRHELMQIHAKLSATMIYVTHDQVEAMTMADRIVILNAGVIEQIGTPLELYAQPRNLFVATFIGSPRMNILGVAAARRAGLVIKDRTELVGIRPEHLNLVEAGTGQFQGTVGLTEHLGADSYYFVELDDGGTVNVRRSDNIILARGERVGLVPEAIHMHQFGADGERLA